MSTGRVRGANAPGVADANLAGLAKAERLVLAAERFIYNGGWVESKMDGAVFVHGGTFVLSDFMRDIDPAVNLLKWTIDEMREALEHIARHPETCPHAKKGFEQQAKCSLCMAATARNALDRIEEANEIQPEAKASEVSENDLVVSSAPGVHGKVSPRRYTKAEVSAAKRLGLARGNLSDADGPIFWATGDHYPALIREQLADFQVVAAAVEREWEA